MVHARKKITMQFAAAVPFALLLLSSGPVFAQQDPPSRVARLNYVNGNVSMEPAGVDEWAPAEVNRPFTIGDYLYADQGGEAELHLDVGVIRIGSQTSFGFLNLDDRTVQLKLTEGDMYIRVHDFGSGQIFEVDTPNAAVTLLQNGSYRFRVDANGNMTFVVARQGQAQITGGGQAFLLNTDNSATLTGTDQLAYQIELAPQPDEFDQWSPGARRSRGSACLAALSASDCDWRRGPGRLRFVAGNGPVRSGLVSAKRRSGLGALSLRALGLDRSVGLDLGG